MKKLFVDFVTWLKKPNPDTTLVNWWKRKRVRDRQRAEEKCRAKIEQKIKAQEQYRESIKKEAYLLWEADGKQEGKDDYYWTKAIEEIEFKKISTIYQPYYLLEKRVLEPVDAWISKQAFFSILGRIGNLAIVVAIVSFVFGENIRRNNEVFTAWQTITSAQGQSGSGGRIEALEFLNSRPLRFPWIGWTEKEWFWDQQEQECILKRLWGLRWKRQPLVGLLAPNNAYLVSIHLCGANLSGANLSEADLSGADLSQADLNEADLSGADLSQAYLFRADLFGANLSGVNLFRANLNGADLFGANLSGVNLFGANLSGADLSGADLSEEDLSQANLSGVNLSGADLSEADLNGADLSGAYLSDAYLSEAYLSEADLSGANLSRANLSEADLRIVINLDPKQVKLACYWEDALFDPEFKEKLKKEPDQKVDCSYWETENQSF